MSPRKNTPGFIGIVCSAFVFAGVIGVMALTSGLTGLLWVAGLLLLTGVFGIFVAARRSKA